MWSKIWARFNCFWRLNKNMWPLLLTWFNSTSSWINNHIPTLYNITGIILSILVLNLMRVNKSLPLPTLSCIYCYIRSFFIIIYIYIYVSYHFSIPIWHSYLKYLSVEENLQILQSQCHGVEITQCINRYGVGLVLWKHCSLNTRQVEFV